MGDTDDTDPQVSESDTADGMLSSSNIPTVTVGTSTYNNTDSHGKKKKHVAGRSA